MRSHIIGGIAIAAVLSTTLVGYRLGAGSWPTFKRQASPPAVVAVAAPAERKVLYWKDPDAGTDFSATPKKTAAGRDYVPIYDDQEPDLPGAVPKPMAASTGGVRKILYYRNPMGLPDTSPAPKKDWMGMDYIAVREGEDDGGSTVKVSLDKVQRSGVRTAPAEMRRMIRPIRAPGVAKIDERTLRTVALRADGFIDKLYVSENGRHVKAGEPLFRVFIPLLARAQVEFRATASSAASGSRDDADATQRLRNLGLSEDAIRQVRNTPKLTGSIDWPSPVSGVIVKKVVVEGMQMKAGEEIFRIADLSTMWIIADVAEQDIGQVKIGATATITLRAYPGETFVGKVTFILHELEMSTRTAKVRIEVPNSDHRIKHEMFADVEINAGADEPERLVVPVSALIDSGNRQVVLIDRGEGRFEPRAVKIGVRGEGVVEITDGIKVGEIVVTSATFLIDAESNLKAALSSFTAEPDVKTEGKP